MAALPSSVKKECGGCDCGRCGVGERASSILHPHIFDPAVDALDSTCTAAFFVLGNLELPLHEVHEVLIIRVAEVSVISTLN